MYSKTLSDNLKEIGLENIPERYKEIAETECQLMKKLLLEK